MIETLLSLTIFGSFIWTAAFLSLFVIFCFVAEYNDNGWIASIALLLVSIVVYYYGGDVWESLYTNIKWGMVFLYLGIGLIHSFIRIFFYGRSQNIKRQRSIKNGDKYPYEIDTNIKQHITRWWLNWPVSLIMWVIKDMIHDFGKYVYQIFGKCFDWILKMGIESVNEKNSK